VLTRKQKPWSLLVLGHGLLGVIAAASGMGETKPSGSGSSGACLLVWAPGEQYRSATGIGDPSLWVTGTLRPACQDGLSGARAAAAGMGESKPAGSRSSEACFSGTGFQKPQELL
jgi:hypothetical protein